MPEGKSNPALYWRSVDQLATRISYQPLSSCSGLELYIGEAWPADQNKPGLPRWRIKKIIYDDECGRMVAMLWAEDSAAFDKVWNSRESYSYGS